MEAAIEAGEPGVAPLKWPAVEAQRIAPGLTLAVEACKKRAAGTVAEFGGPARRRRAASSPERVSCRAFSSVTAALTRALAKVFLDENEHVAPAVANGAPERDIARSCPREAVTLERARARHQKPRGLRRGQQFLGMFSSHLDCLPRIAALCCAA